MAEWLVEEGIGEDRAILVENGGIRTARVDWGGPLRPGAVLRARLAAKQAGSRRGVARTADGAEILVDALPAEVTDGSELLVRVTREAIAERGRNKRAQGRPAVAADEERPAPSLLEQLAEGPHPIGRVRPPDGTFAAHGWDDIVDEALTGEVAFPGGSLTLSPTPAMTLIDVDGTLPPRALALAAVPAIADALRRLDIGGSIGIDFPTLPDKMDRRAVGSCLNAALGDWPHESTAMNGFGFVQLVARLERPSTLARYQAFPARAAAQRLMRRAEAASGPGALLLCANPALRHGLPSDAEQELARRTGRRLHWQWDERLALAAPTVQIVAQ